MPDFSSALYLGLKHPSATLRPWNALSLGRPAALGLPPAAARVEEQLAALLRCRRAVLGTSTLHLFWDWFGGLRPERDVVYADSELYPIGRWGVERARANGVVTKTFPDHNAQALSSRLQSNYSRSKRPVLVTDGLCPECGRPAPLREYVLLARRFRGLVVVDDTQALGILGAKPEPPYPYGRGGGGIIPWSGLAFQPEVIVIASLAKGFGVPIAVLAASVKEAEKFQARSETRSHCSPPSIAAIHAAARALNLNRSEGEKRRRRLTVVVRGFRNAVRELGCATSGGLSPMQSLLLPRGADAECIYGELSRRGIRTVLRKAPGRSGPTVTFILSADCNREDIESAIAALAAALRKHQQPKPSTGQQHDLIRAARVSKR